MEARENGFLLPTVVCSNFLYFVRLSGVGVDCRLYLSVSVVWCWLSFADCWLSVVAVGGCFWLLIARCRVSGDVCLLSVSFVAQFFHCRCPALPITFVLLCCRRFRCTWCTYYKCKTKKLTGTEQLVKAILRISLNIVWPFFCHFLFFHRLDAKVPVLESLLSISCKSGSSFLLNFILSYFSTYWLCELKKF